MPVPVGNVLVLHIVLFGYAVIHSNDLQKNLLWQKKDKFSVFRHFGEEKSDISYEK
jgi:hypothetical protein